MKQEPQTCGIPPSLMYDTREKLHLEVLEVSGDLKKIQDFCLQHGIEVSRFFITVWVIAYSQFAERDCVYLGFEDLRVHLKPKVGAQLNLIKATIQAQTHIQSLLRGDDLGLQLSLCKEDAAECSTALYIAGDEAQIDLGDWLESGKFGKLVGRFLLDIVLNKILNLPIAGSHNGS
jgi:hypothetical protein